MGFSNRFLLLAVAAAGWLASAQTNRPTIASYCTQGDFANIVIPPCQVRPSCPSPSSRP